MAQTTEEVFNKLCSIAGESGLNIKIPTIRNVFTNLAQAMGEDALKLSLDQLIEICINATTVRIPVTTKNSRVVACKIYRKGVLLRSEGFKVDK